MRASLVFLVAVAGSPLATVQAQQPSVTIHILANGTCQIAGDVVACTDVGSKLQALHVPTGSVINLMGERAVKYKPVAAAAGSLKSARYRTKIAYITIDGGEPK